MYYEKFDISVVIPVYGSSNHLKNLYQRITNILFEMGVNYEIIFVEDSGPDDAWEIIKEISLNDLRVKGYKLSKNFGQHNALLCGIRHSEGKLIITMDDDLQHPPEEIPNLINEINNGYDVVYGKPYKDKKNIPRKIFTKLTKSVLSLAIGNFRAKKMSSFRVFRGSLKGSFENFNSEIINIDILLTYAAKNFSEINVKNNYRSSGKSGYNLLKLSKHTINILTGFSTAPLHFASIIGITLSIFGLVIFCYVFIMWLLYKNVLPGFTFLASIISIFSGAQLLAVGILGEYIARIHKKLLNKPSYIVSEKINTN